MKTASKTTTGKAADKNKKRFLLELSKDDNMTYRQVYEVKENSLIITLPPAFKNKQVVVTVDDSASIPKDRLLLIKQAAHDPIYR